MRKAALGRALLAGTLLASVAVEARGEPSEPAASPPLERTVVLRLEPDEWDAARAEALVKLIRTELGELGLELRVEHTRRSESLWFGEWKEQSALLLASVDVAEDTGFRVSLVDPERGRASVRELGPDAADNAAMLEAVASVLISAAAVLVQGEEATADSPEPGAEARAIQPAPEPDEAPVDAPVDPPDPPALSRPWRLHAAVGLSTSSFEASELATFGPEFGFGLVHDAGFAVGLGARRHFAAHYQTEFGAFSITRSALALRAGPVVEHGSWLLLPELHTSLEWLQREQGQGAPEQVAAPGYDITRWAFGAGVGARFAVSDVVSLDAALDAAYFPRPVRLTANDGADALAAPWSLVVGAFVGVGVRL